MSSQILVLKLKITISLRGLLRSAQRTTTSVLKNTESTSKVFHLFPVRRSVSSQTERCLYTAASSLHSLKTFSSKSRLETWFRKFIHSEETEQLSC